MTELVESKKGGKISLVIGGILLAVDAFGLDLLLSGSVPIGVLYALVVVLGLWWTDRSYIITAAVAGTILCLLGFYFSSASNPMSLEIANRGIGIFVIWMVASLCYFHKKEKIEKAELLRQNDRIGQEHCAMEKALKESRETYLNLEKETREKLQALEKEQREKIQVMEKNASLLQLNILEKEAQLDQVEQTLKEQEKRLQELAKGQDKKEELDRLQESLDLLLNNQMKTEEHLKDNDARIKKSEEDRNRTAGALWEKEQRLADVLNDLNLLENDLKDKVTAIDQMEEALKHAHDQLHEKDDRLRTMETRLDNIQKELYDKERFLENFEHKMLALENKSEQAQKLLQDKERLLKKIEQQIHESLIEKPEDIQERREPEEQNGDKPPPGKHFNDDDKAQERYNRYTRELERSNQDLKEFASIASHDLKEPIRKIIGFGLRLKKDCSPYLDDKGKDYLERMGHSAQKMQKFIDDLLQYSTATALSPRHHPVDLKEVISQVLADLETRIEATHAQIEVGSLPVIECDRMQMTQLFQNLISNAIKFHKKGVPPMILISHLLLENGSHEIRVQDQGIGFDEKYEEHIFKPFERLHGNSEYEGTGMGLAICRKIVQRHGGKLTAQSSLQEGTAFIISLPSPGKREKI
jgi:signal transduction histidine kinase